MPVTPMNEFCLISDNEALTTPRTATLSAIFTLYVVWPSRDLTVSIGPSTPSTVPRTRTVGDCCWAKVADVASSKAKPAAPKARRIVWSIVILLGALLGCRRGIAPFIGCRRSSRWRREANMPGYLDRDQR